MPRTRQLRHGFFINEDLAALNPLTRLLFAGLWLLADREGRLEDRPTRIKGQLFPYHDADINGMLTELVPGGFVTRYKVDGVGYIELPGFSKNQHVHKDEKVSEIPKNPEIPGKNRRNPEIPPSSPSSSSSTSPSSFPKETTGKDFKRCNWNNGQCHNPAVPSGFLCRDHILKAQEMKAHGKRDGGLKHA